MFSNFKFFQKQYQKYLRIDFNIDVTTEPIALILAIKNIGAQKQTLKLMIKKTQNGFKIMRRLTIAHLLLIYSNKFYDMVEQFVQYPIYSSDQWLNQHCIRTYYYFLRKIVASRELYIKIKKYSTKQVGFQSIFYTINLMNDMFKIVNKMPMLGRYFKDTNLTVTSSFVQAIAIQAQILYSFFKNSLQEILTYSQNYIVHREDERLVKVIVEESLVNLNQQMKKLFLDKYFYPYGKGIGIKLFRTEEQPGHTLKIINGIISQHKDTQRNMAQADLQKTIFPESGQINLEFFQRTLKPTQTKYEQITVKDLQQIEQEQIIPTHFDETSVEIGKYQKQTIYHIQICQDI